MIPESIKREHILKALEEITRSEIPAQRSSEKFDLEYNNRLYPPKYVISIANKYANNYELDHSAFGGGDETNTFLKSMGFNIIDKKEGFREDLQEFLERRFPHVVIKQYRRSWLRFGDTGTQICVNGSKRYDKNRGWYDLDESIYNTIIAEKSYLAIIFGHPQTTFVLRSTVVYDIFNDLPKLESESKNPRWMFSILQNNSNYIMSFTGRINHDITAHLNKWETIPELKGFKEGLENGTDESKIVQRDTHYFLIQVSRQGSENLLRNNVYTHQNWRDTPRDGSHGTVKAGDILVVYFAGNSIEFERQIGKLYRVDSVLDDNVRFNVSEIKELSGITFEVIKDAIQNGKIRNEVFNKVGQQGFNIIEIEKSDFDQLLSLDNAPTAKKPLLNFVDLQKFLLKKMQMQANYQPIMIKTLLVSDGKASKDDIAAKIKELNPDNQQDFKNIPVYDVLEKRGIVRKEGNYFILNSSELTEEQRQQLIAICNWKVDNMPLQREELIQAFNENKALFGERVQPEEAERIRSAFVSDFPMEKIHLLELDQYVIGKPLPTTGEINKATYCYRLLYQLGVVLSGFGVKSPFDFGIYYSQKSQRYMYKDEQKYASPQEAFNRVKSEIYSILESGKQYNADHDIDNLVAKLNQDYSIERRVISKILSVYYPSDFLHIHSQKQIEVILEAFGKPMHDVRDNFFLAQSRLLEVKNSHPIMNQWNNNDFSSFIWRGIIERKSKKNEKVENISQLDDKSPVSLFITGYNNENLEISKREQLLGWVNSSSYLSEGSLVYVFNKDKLAFETCFRIKSKLIDDRLIWADEKAKNNKIYSNRWKAEIVYDGLNITLEDIRKIPPFDEEPFQGLLRGNFPMPLDSPTNSYKYARLKEMLLKTINQPYSPKPEIEELRSVREFIDAPLAFPDVGKIDEAIQTIKEKFLVDEDTIKHIVISLVSGKNILLAGPVGTGKTSLSKIISEYFWKSGDNDGYFSNTFTATSEWTSQDVMGGLMPRMREETLSYEIVYGCVSETVMKNWSSMNHDQRTEIKMDGRKFKGMWLVIDEFNRADIDKVFGQLFTSLESRILKVPSAQGQNGYREILIPLDYRIIGTLNTADKHYLFKLSDALKRRFAYIEILPPNSSQKNLEIYYAFKNAIDELGNNFDNLIILNHETKTIDMSRTEPSFVQFIENAYYVIEFIRMTKPLGTAILKSIYQTMLVGIKLTGDYEKSLDFALTSNIIPQLENLRLSTLEMIVSFLFYDIIEFFKEIHKGNEREQYKEDYRNFLAFISASKPETKLRDFVSQNVQEDGWNSISYNLPEKMHKISAGLFKKSLKDLVKISVI